MKHVLRAAAVLTFSFLMCIRALAAGQAVPERVFVYQDKLYAYMRLEGIDKPITKVEARIDGQSFAATDHLETVRQAGYPVTYLLLIDNSNSMPPFREELEAFCSTLYEGSGGNTRFIIALFGDKLEIVNEDAKSSLSDELASIPMDEPVTRLHTSMEEALDYFESMPRSGSELREMIVITDGVQYDPIGKTSYDELLERIKASDVIVHSIGMGSDTEALDSLGGLTEASGGLHQVIASEGGTSAELASAEEAAEKLSETAGDIMVTGFSLNGQAQPGEDKEVSFTFASGSELICKGETLVDIPEPDQDYGQAPAAAVENGAGEADTGIEEETEVSEGSEIDTETEIPAETESEALTEVETEVTGTAKFSDDSGVSPVTFIIAAAVIAAAAVILILLKKSRSRSLASGSEQTTDGGRPCEDGDDRGIEYKRETDTGTKAEDISDGAFDSPSGIYIRIVSEEGRGSENDTELMLCGEALIGRDETSDLRLDSDEAPLKAARLYLDDKGFICIEPLSQDAEILINDEKLSSARRLRSGDRLYILGERYKFMF